MRYCWTACSWLPLDNQQYACIEEWTSSFAIQDYYTDSFKCHIIRALYRDPVMTCPNTLGEDYQCIVNCCWQLIPH
jgi:hypothetical protein